MSIDIGWGGVPVIRPSTLASRYLYYEDGLIPERCIETGARFRARKGIENTVRGYNMLKKEIRDSIADMEHERRLAHANIPQISTSGVSASKLSAGMEHTAPMDPIYYHDKCCSFRPAYTRCPVFKRRLEIGFTEPRAEAFLGHVDIRRKMLKNPSEQ
jgi:hypothetical protein